MTSHSLLALVFAMSCFTSSSCNDGGDIASVPVTYPPKVLSTTQEECPPDDQRETVRAEVEQDICYILRVYVGKTMQCCTCDPLLLEFTHPSRKCLSKPYQS